MTLYELTGELRQLQAMLEENGGELTPEIEDALNVNESNYKDKIKGYAMVVLDYESKVDNIDNEVKRLSTLKKTAENSITRLKDRVLDAMQEFNPALKEDFGTIKLSTRRSERIVIEDSLKVPAQFFIAKEPEISKTLIKEAMKNGELVPGIAIEQNVSLQIR